MILTCPVMPRILLMTGLQQSTRRVSIHAPNLFPFCRRQDCEGGDFAEPF